MRDRPHSFSRVDLILERRMHNFKKSLKNVSRRKLLLMRTAILRVKISLFNPKQVAVIEAIENLAEMYNSHGETDFIAERNKIRQMIRGSRTEFIEDYQFPQTTQYAAINYKDLAISNAYFTQDYGLSVVMENMDKAYGPEKDAGIQIHLSIVRSIIDKGDLGFRPPPILIETIKEMYETRNFDYDRLMIMADMMEEEGCTHPEALKEMRTTERYFGMNVPKFRGFWVADRILGLT